MALALEAKVAVVTGGNRGIRLAIAKTFVDEGAEVYITGRRQAEQDSWVARLGASATAIRADVADMASLDALFDTIRQPSGKIDVLVAKAGSGAFEPLGAISEEQFDTTFVVNVKGTLFTVQNALLLLRDGAAVVLTT